MADEDVWVGFARDPRQAAYAELRASDADRELIREVLTAAYGDGRLDRAELDDRAEQLAAARTLGELPPLVADLVPSGPATPTVPGLLTPAQLHERAVADWRSDRREAVWGLFAVSAIVWVIWALTGADFPWPVFVTLAAALNVGKVQFTREQRVETERRRLERKQAKRLSAREEEDDSS